MSRDFTVTSRASGLRDMIAANVAKLTAFVERMSMRAKVNSPFETGNNRDSIDFQKTDDKGPTFEVFTESGYGAYLELGTSRMAAQPHFAPAFAESKADLEAGRLT